MIAERKRGGRPNTESGQDLEPLTDEQRELASDPFFVDHINRIATRFAKRWRWVDRQSLVSFLSEAAVVAVRNHDGSKGANLRTYVATRISFAVKDYCRQEGARGLAEAGGHIRRNGRLRHDFISINTVVIEARPDHESEEAMSREHAISWLSGLSERSRSVIVGYVLDGKTMKQVGEEHGMSESRVSQLYAQLMSQLREPVRRRLEATA